jgi:EmrB/QacA subfamily drug resistance transporter
MANPAKTIETAQIAGIDRKWWVLLAIGVGTFMSALDTSVVNTVLPVINADFRTAVATIEWVVIVYLLVLSGLLLSFGRLGDLRGHKPVYIGGFIIFIAGSALCGLSRSVWMLITVRGLQALGAAMLSANSPAILTKAFPDNQRGQALGLQATMTYLGLTVGPSLGGWLTQQYGWRSVFYINVPVGLIALILSLAVILPDRPSENHEGFDLLGGLVFMAGLIALLLGLNQGHSWGWGSPAVLGLLAAALLLLGLFIRIERRVRHPMLDLSLFHRRLFSSSTVSAVLNYICVYSNLFLMPFYLIQARGLNPAQAGLLLTAQPIVMALAAPISGALSDRIGARLLSTLGMAILAAGLLLLGRLELVSSLTQVAAALAVAGVGIGVFISPNSSALLGSAPRHRQGIASGILATARNVGMVLGVGLAGAVFTTVLERSSTQDALGLVSAVQTSYLVVTSAAVLGIFVSALRGNGEESARL